MDEFAKFIHTVTETKNVMRDINILLDVATGQSLLDVSKKNSLGIPRTREIVFLTARRFDYFLSSIKQDTPEGYTSHPKYLTDLRNNKDFYLKFLK